jgi:hypothetical protein
MTKRNAVMYREAGSWHWRLTGARGALLANSPQCQGRQDCLDKLSAVTGCVVVEPWGDDEYLLLDIELRSAVPVKVLA